MNSHQVSLVQTTFAQHVVPLGDTAAEVFYQKLFAHDPALRPMFRGDMAAQRRHLLQALAFVVTGLHAPERVLPAVRELGRRHVGYGVAPGHYATVGAALLDTLATAMGDAFTPEVREAWGAAYGVLAGEMQAAAALAA